MAPPIPLVDLEALHRPLRSELLEAFGRCLDRSTFILGEEVERFEKAVAAYCEAPYALGVSSGTDALLMALMVHGIGRGDQVLTSALSFFATASAVTRLGARPAFVDIEEDTFQLDPALLEAGISETTRVVVPVHLYGQCAGMAPILEIARSRGLSVVEDAAQAIGAREGDGRRAGTLGSVGVFSFYPSKNLGALGDAGLVVTGDEGLRESLKRIRVHGAATDYIHETVGGNFRIDAIQAALLAVKLPHLDDWTRRRRERARRYDELFDESGLVGEGMVVTPKVRADHVFHQYVLRVPRREELRRHLSSAGIATGVYYPLPLHLQPCFRDLGYARGDFPAAEKASGECLAIPMYPDLTEEQQRRVVDSMAGFYLG